MNEIREYVRQMGRLDGECVNQMPDRYPVTHAQFLDYVESVTPEDWYPYRVPGETFTTYAFPDGDLVVTLAFGQGSSYAVFTREAWERWRTRPTPRPSPRIRRLREALEKFKQLSPEERLARLSYRRKRSPTPERQPGWLSRIWSIITRSKNC